jgi:hypothetical protein
VTIVWVGNLSTATGGVSGYHIDNIASRESCKQLASAIINAPRAGANRTTVTAVCVPVQKAR